MHVVGCVCAWNFWTKFSYFTVGIVSRNLATTSNFVKFRDNWNFTFFEAPSIEGRKTGLRDM